ncbi:hypothetical protein BV22DRAFT_1028662 [Leucogyrophana mollusca]|uniref:Uncharacterized protein n=1 Tax=Leucogyrophana mollusca TaxID=85980 RepID=A0ACB8BXE8_9AGAM|nr:hypothetical protein BV22DRAFT_1028662 [Leucogyrophana mollusca]
MHKVTISTAVSSTATTAATTATVYPGALWRNRVHAEISPRQGQCKPRCWHMQNLNFGTIATSEPETTPVPGALWQKHVHEEVSARDG